MGVSGFYLRERKMEVMIDYSINEIDSQSEWQIWFHFNDDRGSQLVERIPYAYGFPYVRAEIQRLLRECRKN